MTVLPTLTDGRNRRRATYRVTRLDLYDAFMRYWFERAQKRLHQIRVQLKSEGREALEALEDWSFVQSVLDFA